MFAKHAASVTGAGGLPAGAVAPIHGGARPARLRGVSGKAFENRFLVTKSNHQDILPFDPKYYPFGDQCHEWVNPIKGRKTSSVQRLPDVPAPIEPWMSCGSGCKIQIIPSTWARILLLLFLIRSLLLIAVFAGNTSCLSFLRPLWSSSTR